MLQAKYQPSSTQAALQLAELHRPELGLSIIIAYIDNHTYPALGGCRLVQQPCSPKIITLCQQLAYTMQDKAKLHQLPLTGGKSIICMDPHRSDKKTALYYYAQLLNQLKGQYITAVDMGIDQADMDIIAQHSPHTTCDTQSGGDPSAYTAETVLLGIQAALQWRYNTSSLKQKKVLIYGAGKVGYQLAKRLHQHNADIIVTDIDSSKAKRCQTDFNATIVNYKQALEHPCDIFSPCASQYVINEDTVDQLQCQIIAGATNNPIKEYSCYDSLKKNNILYLPDYWLNAGGLIHCAHQVSHNFNLQDKINQVYPLTLSLLKNKKVI